MKMGKVKVYSTFLAGVVWIFFHSVMVVNSPTTYKVAYSPATIWST